MSKQSSSSLMKNPINDVIYECNLNSKIDGVEIGSLIEFVFNRVGINSKGIDEKETYKVYCSSLQKMLGSPEPLQVSSSLNESNRDINITKMLSILPKNEASITSNIEQAVKKTWWDIFNDFFLYIIQKFESNKESFLFENIEYTIIRVSKSGENIEIIPSYMKIDRKVIKKKGGYNIYSDSDSTVEYKQEKFVLTQFDTKEIINKIKSSRPIGQNIPELRKRTPAGDIGGDETFVSIDENFEHIDKNKKYDGRE